MKLSYSLRWIFFSVSLVLLSAVWIWLSQVPIGSVIGGGIQAPRQGFQAPDFTLSTLSGETIKLSELRGQPLVINFWASWCPPCRAEMPALQNVYEDNQEYNFVVLAINATNQDNLNQAEAFVREHNLTFPILLDLDGNVSRSYQLGSLPSTYFVGADGEIQEVVIGGPMAEALLRVRVENLLNEVAP